MFSVLFPTGVRVTYNRANWFQTRGQVIELYTANPADKPDARWVATIPLSTGCVVEAEPASKTDIPGQLSDWELGAKVQERLRHLSGMRLKELKSALNDFDARSQTWKD